MRRTRHMVLPVRSWQYIGLLIVSLACLTLGLVSRDREGHAGSLAGPELEHRAPHEMDACPNLNLFTEMSSHLFTKLEETAKSVETDYGAEISTSKTSPTTPRSVHPRSLSLDRSTRVASQKARGRSSQNREARAVERLSGRRSRSSDNEPINSLRESQFRTIAQFRDARNSIEPASRNSRSRDLPNRATDRRSFEQRSFNFDRRLADRSANYRSEERRSRSAERREINEVARRLNRVGRLLDHRALSIERRVSSEIARRESPETLISHREFRDSARRVDQRSEMRERRSRSAERREDRRSLLIRSVRIVGKDTDRNNNLDRRNQERSLENRRALLYRVVNQERRSRSSAATRDSRKDLTRSDDRRSLSRSMERASDVARETLDKRVRLAESNDERSRERRSSSERRSLTRSMERREADLTERRKMESRFRDRRSRDRAPSRTSPEDLRRAGLGRSQRVANARDSRENVANRESTEVALVREGRSRYNLEETASRIQRQRLVRFSRSLDLHGSVDRRELSRSRDSTRHDRESRDSSERRNLAVERRERTVLQKSRSPERGSERRISGRVLERRASREKILEKSHRRVAVGRTAADPVQLASRRSSERRIDESSRSREESRMADRRLEQSLELRASRGRTLEKRSALDSRRSSDRRIIGSSRSREESRMVNRRLEQDLELRVSRRRTLEKRSTLDSRRVDENSRSREEFRKADRRLERSLEMRASRGKTLEKRSPLDSRRSSERRIIGSSRSREESRMVNRRLEQDLELRASRGRTLEKRSTLDSRRVNENSRSREEFRKADRRLERSLEMRASRGRTLEKRSPLDSRRSSEQRIVGSSRSREESRMANRRLERGLELRASRGRTLEKRSALDSRKSSERRIDENLRLANIFKGDTIRQLRERSSSLNIKESSTKPTSLRQVVRVSRVPEQNRERRSLSAERMLSKIADHERLSAKWERNLQNTHVDRNVEIRTKIVPNSAKNNQFLKYPMTYDFIRQAVVIALCTIYGLSLYNGKKSFLRNNIVQQVQRFTLW